MNTSDKCIRCGGEIFESKTLSRCLRCGRSTEREVSGKDYYQNKQANVSPINLPGEETTE